MALILLRYGEIGLKGQNRAYFMRKLRRNVRRCLKAHGIPGKVWQEGQRIYLETEQVSAAVEAVRRVFGLVSLSPVEVVAPDLQAIEQVAVAMAERIGLDATHSFRVRTNRADKSFPVISPEVDRHVGAAIVEATAARVDLSQWDQADERRPVEIGIEIQAKRALVFGETVAGPGGLPLGSQGRVVLLMSSGIDSPVAGWLMMKRGCSVIPVHFSTGQAQTDQVQAIARALNRWAYGWEVRPIILSHQEAMAPVLARLRDLHQERWTCIFCKRTMLAKAAEVAEKARASALVTGDSLGQVASQTLSNLEAISHGIQKPILRPLIGMDKTEIMALARHIGTYDASIEGAHTCPFLPDHPLTQATMAHLHELADLLGQTTPMEQIGVPVPGQDGEPRG